MREIMHIHCDLEIFFLCFKNSLTFLKTDDKFFFSFYRLTFKSQLKNENYCANV